MKNNMLLVFIYQETSRHRHDNVVSHYYYKFTTRNAIYFNSVEYIICKISRFC